MKKFQLFLIFAGNFYKNPIISKTRSFEVIPNLTFKNGIITSFTA